MSEHQQDGLDHQASDHMDAGSQDELQAHASDQLDQDASDQLDASQAGSQEAPGPVERDAQISAAFDAAGMSPEDQAKARQLLEGDGETTGDQNVAPVFPDDDAPDQDDQDDELAVTQPHPYVNGFGLVGKFDSEAAPSADDAGNIIQDDGVQDDQDESQ